jgi:hypothetical protein
VFGAFLHDAPVESSDIVGKTEKAYVLVALNMWLGTASYFKHVSSEILFKIHLQNLAIPVFSYSFHQGRNQGGGGSAGLQPA